MKEAETLQAIDQAIEDHHAAVSVPGEPAMIVGWTVAYIAVDGNGAEIFDYVAGQGTTTATTLGLCEWTKNIILNGGSDDEGDEYE